jgi:hypothetical protein
MAQAAVPDTKVEAAQNHPRKVRAPSEGSARFASAWELNGIAPEGGMVERDACEKRVLRRTLLLRYAEVFPDSL